MEKILKGSQVRIGEMMREIDANFLDVAGWILKTGYPELTLKGIAEPASVPAAPADNDAWLINTPGTVWDIEDLETDDILFWDDTEKEWTKTEHGLQEINAAIQTKFFNAENIAIEPVPGMTATNVQEAIEELYLLVQSLPAGRQVVSSETMDNGELIIEN